jgi:hypothetical protein
VGLLPLTAAAMGTYLPGLSSHVGRAYDGGSVRDSDVSSQSEAAHLQSSQTPLIRACRRFRFLNLYEK